MSEKVVYVGRDLEAISFAVNYYRWILQTFSPCLGTRLVEVGAGLGGFSELLLERAGESLALVEPSTAMYSKLAERFQRSNLPIRVETYNALFEEVADEIKLTHHPDSIIYVNVLEHIEHDEQELRIIWRTLEPKGRAFIFVPALPWLYGNFDKEIGHFRRYTRAELADKCERAGFRILKLQYFDLLGVPAWWFEYRLRKSSGLDPNKVKLYDKFVVPITKLVETTVSPPIGKNLLLIAEKT